VARQRRRERGAAIAAAVRVRDAAAAGEEDAEASLSSLPLAFARGVETLAAALSLLQATKLAVLLGRHSYCGGPTSRSYRSLLSSRSASLLRCATRGTRWMGGARGSVRGWCIARLFETPFARECAKLEVSSCVTRTRKPLPRRTAPRLPARRAPLAPQVDVREIFAPARLPPGASAALHAF
jgi:hypothetical protein